MLGRGVAEHVRSRPGEPLFSDEVIEAARGADALVLNLECCVSTRGAPWPAPGKPFFFRAPPEALAHLRALGADCVTLANNHALDFGETALLDTLAHLDDAGIAAVGAGADVAQARAPHVLRAGDLRIAVLGLSDHPRDFAAAADRPGIAFADLGAGELPEWVGQAVAAAGEAADLVLVLPHWGPNMVERPLPEVRAAGRALLQAGASLVAGHSAHVFQGVEGPILWDLGDFVDDYAVDPVLRNDRGLLWIVTLDAAGPRRVEAIPLQLEYCYTRLARERERDWIVARMRAACDELGTDVELVGDRLVLDIRR
jgi:poly-gamma-glutamate synthesis protein (capsule biosynthesis protein)